jgi:hypothetical protein
MIKIKSKNKNDFDFVNKVSKKESLALAIRLNEILKEKMCNYRIHLEYKICRVLMNSKLHKIRKVNFLALSISMKHLVYSCKVKLHYSQLKIKGY